MVLLPLYALRSEEILGPECTPDEARMRMQFLGIPEGDEKALAEDDRNYRLKQIERDPRMPWRNTRAVDSLVISLYSNMLDGLRLIPEWRKPKFMIREDQLTARIWFLN